jgi:electron transport complex, rnfABCDGE type, D subunit
MEQKLTISTSPHDHSRWSVQRCMWNVVIALLPTAAVGIWVFGLPALWTLLLSIVGCLAAEWLIDLWMGRKCTISDGSALITGILLACNLPAILPWWMVLIGAIVAIGIGKMSFGGLGTNIWNPALVGRVFLLVSFPAAMTTWPSGVHAGIQAVSGASHQVDASSGATFLAQYNADWAAHTQVHVDLMNLFTGQMNGSLGEVGAIAILAGLAWLLLTRVITWHIPVAVLAGAAGLSAALGCNPLYDLLSGGLLLGAVFMATDYVTSPTTHKGQIIYGLMIGFLTIIIRRFGSYPEGMSFAILLMNSATPLINHYCKPRRYGHGRRKEVRA